MQNLSVPIAPKLTLRNGIPTTTSLDVAEFFNKRHDSVLRTVENLCEQLDEEHRHNFVETVVERQNPSGGAPIKSPAYTLTRDGFTLLAMGFTGKKALQFKLAYIDAFNQMEAAQKQPQPKLTQKPEPRELPPLHLPAARGQTIGTAQAINHAIYIWAIEADLNELKAATEILSDTLRVGFTEVEETSFALNCALNYLRRWQGKKMQDKKQTKTEVPALMRDLQKLPRR